LDVSSRVTTILFTDIEGSTRLWEQEGERMAAALAQHDARARVAVEGNHGTIVKTTGDGLFAAFDDPLDAVKATVRFQQSLVDPAVTNGIAIRVRCGLHLGVVERRDNDYFGTPVNRTARIMSVAHGGQILVSQAVVDEVGTRLPDPIALRDLGNVRLKDLSSPEHVYQLVHPELRADFPALRSLEATPNNLPEQLTSFIGRERELEEATQLLKGSRLLTLLGMGGLGKTRLSLQIAADMLDSYPDGIWFLDLAPIRDPSFVPHEAAQVLAVREEPGKPLTHTLCAHLKSRKALLIFDNCEQVVSACASLANALLRAAPDIRIIASSREALRVPGRAGLSRCCRSRCPSRRQAWKRCRGRKPSSSSWRARSCKSRLCADGARSAGGGRALRARRRHSARARARRSADALACRCRRSTSGCTIASRC
jgi:class 3 adenylate cyclase